MGLDEVIEKMVDDKDIFGKIVGRQVKVLYRDEEQTKKVTGTLNHVTDNFIVVNDVIVGLGPNFISLIPIKESPLPRQ